MLVGEQKDPTRRILLAAGPGGKRGEEVSNELRQLSLT